MMTQIEMDFMRLVPSRMNELSKRMGENGGELMAINMNLEVIAKMLGEIANELKRIG